MSVVVLGSIALVVVIGLSTGTSVSVSDSRSIMIAVQAHQAANACAEEALNQLRIAAGPSSGSLTLNGASCTYTTTSTGGTTYSVATTGIANNATRHITVTVTTVSPAVTLSTWRDVAGP